MKNTKILTIFVGVSVLLWFFVLLAIFFLPKFGYGNYLELVFKAHPTIILMASFPLIAKYMNETDEPMPYVRALKLSGIALIFLLPLTVLSESLNASALVATMGIADLVPESQRNYVIFTYRGLTLTVFGTLLGLGYIFPAQVKFRQKKLK